MLPSLARLAIGADASDDHKRARLDAGADAPAPPPKTSMADLGEDALNAVLANIKYSEMSLFTEIVDYESVCRAAARWCALNTEHRAACDAGGDALWTALAARIFPNAPAPAPALGHGGARARFYELCDQARTRDYHNGVRKLEDHPNDQNVKRFVLAAVGRWDGGYALEYASEDLQDDFEVVLSAVNTLGSSLEFASPALQNDRQIVLAAVFENKHALVYASSELRSNRVFMLARVRHDFKALQVASLALQTDPEVVRVAILQDPLALQYASYQLRSDPEFMLETMRQDVNALRWATEELQKDPEFMLSAVRESGLALKYASAEIQNDFDIAFEAVSNNQAALIYVADRLQNQIAYWASGQQ